MQTHQTPLPLDPRDSFFGGRTNAYQLYKRVEGDEGILDYNFKSLYLYVNKYCCYPIGQPQIISQPPLDQGLDPYFGLVCCTILPPPICCIPSCRTDAARSSRFRCVPLASASTSMLCYLTRMSTTVITPTPNALSPARGVPPNSVWPSQKVTYCSTLIRSTIFPKRKWHSLPSTSTRGSNSRKKPAGIPISAPQDTFNANTCDDGTNAKTLFSTMPTSAKTRVNVLWLISC